MAGNAILERANRRQAQASSFDKSAWVTASAGSGKTKVLTERVLNLMLAGTRPSAILCLTYTKAAATEMAIRINNELSKWATASDAVLLADLEKLLGHPADGGRMRAARRLFAQVLDIPGGTKIMTIHAFCQSILRRFPIEAGIAPHFEVMTERDSAEALDFATAHVLGTPAASHPELAQAIDEITSKVHQQNFPALLSSLRNERALLGSLLARHNGLTGLINHTYHALGVEPDDTQDNLIAAACADDAFDREGLLRVGAVLSQGSEKTDQPKALLISRWLEQSPTDRCATFNDYTGVFLTKKSTPLAPSKLHTKKMTEKMAALPDIMAAEQARLYATVGQIKALGIGRSTAALLTLGAAILDAYHARKEALALKDYDDLILDTNHLLSRSGAAAWVLYKLDGGIDHILIDEAQDTSAVQWQLVRALADEFYSGLGAGDDVRPVPRTMFAVGDIKQSIFSFQDAEPRLFGENKAHFMSLANGAERPFADVELDVSFRSTEPVLHAVDAVFSKASARDGVTEPGIDLQHHAFRAGAGGMTELWNLVEPQSRDVEASWKPPVESVEADSPKSRLARLLAIRIKAWLSSGEILESKGRPIEPGDIMILVRRRDALVTETVRALKELDVPVSGVDRMVLTEQLAVEDLMALGQFVLLPEDDLTLATVLKGPLVGFDEEDLFTVAHDRKAGLWQALGLHAKSGAPYAGAHAYLTELLAKVDFSRPYEFYATLLARGGRAKIIARLGAEVLDAIDEFLSLALEYERTNTPSLQGFLHWLDAGGAEIKRDLDRATSMVRIMTVHGAKGLQAPIVILPDTCQIPRARDQLFRSPDKDVLLWAPRAEDRDPVCTLAAEVARADIMREQNRLLYVAMTRAEDRLYICGWRGTNQPPQDCWYELISLGLENFVHETVDPVLADSPIEIDPMVKRIAKDQIDPPTIKEQGETLAIGGALPGWAKGPPPPEPTPRRPLAPSRPAIEAPAPLSPLGKSKDGGYDVEAGFRRGRLIHALLQHLPNIARPDRLAAAKSFLVTTALGLDQNGRTELVSEVLAILDHPVYGALFGPGSHAELPVTGLVEVTGEAVSGKKRRSLVVSGRIDRLLVEEKRVLVVDFKTNRPPPIDPSDVPPIYLEQMAAYRTLLADIYPGKQIDCALLWTVGPYWTSLDSAALDKVGFSITA